MHSNWDGHGAPQPEFNTVWSINMSPRTNTRALGLEKNTILYILRYNKTPNKPPMFNHRGCQRSSPPSPTFGNLGGLTTQVTHKSPYIEGMKQWLLNSIAVFETARSSQLKKSVPNEEEIPNHFRSCTNGKRTLNRVCRQQLRLRTYKRIQFTYFPR